MATAENRDVPVTGAPPSAPALPPGGPRGDGTDGTLTPGVPPSEEPASEPGEDPAGEAALPDESEADPNRRIHGRLDALTIAGMGLFVLAVGYTLYTARAFILPVVLALLLDRLLSPVVRSLKRFRLSAPAGTFVVMTVFAAVMTLAVYYFSTPAAQWIEQAPEQLQVVEYKLRGLTAPVERVQEAAREIEEATQGNVSEVEQQVALKEPTITETILSQTQGFLVGAVVVLCLLYFLLASGDEFLRKLVQALPRIRDKKKAIEITRCIERDLSTYLLTMTMINIGLGTAVALALYLIGMPNPVLWGLMVGLLNYIPYLGPLLGVMIIGIVAFASFDDVGQALAAPASYFIINALEGYVVTPWIVGRRLTLNPVFIFISLIFWGWIWGIPGALMAVPLLVAIKILCDNIDVLNPVGAFLGR